MSELSTRRALSAHNVGTVRVQGSAAARTAQADSPEAGGTRSATAWRGIAEYFDSSRRAEAEALFRQALDAATATDRAAAYLALKEMAPHGRQQHFEAIYSPSDGTFALCIDPSLAGVDKVQIPVKAVALTPAQCKALFPPMHVPEQGAWQPDPDVQEPGANPPMSSPSDDRPAS